MGELNQPASIPLGTRLKGTAYRLDRLIGAGAMGEVFMGEHEGLRRPAVVKVIHAHHATDPQVVGRMIREARIVANLDHPSIVRIYDLGTSAEGRTYIAMEYLEGEILRQRLRQQRIFSPRNACLMMAQALDGLGAAHKAGVIHRDVKPENLLLTAHGQLKVLDFGVAKVPMSANQSGLFTAAGMVLGTPRYMAPEQARGHVLSAATDVYAVGCVLFECLTGESVFAGDRVEEVLHAHLCTEAPTLSARTGHIFDPELEAVVARALRKSPSERYTHASEMAHVLRSIASRVSEASLPPGTVLKASTVLGYESTAMPPMQEAISHAEAVTSHAAPLSLHAQTTYLPSSKVAAESVSINSDAKPNDRFKPQPTLQTEILAHHTSELSHTAFSLSQSIPVRRTSTTSRGPQIAFFVAAIGGVLGIGSVTTLSYRWMQRYTQQSSMRPVALAFDPLALSVRGTAAPLASHEEASLPKESSAFSTSSSFTVSSTTSPPFPSSSTQQPTPTRAQPTTPLPKPVVPTAIRKKSKASEVPLQLETERE